MDCLISCHGQFNHGKSENRGLETLGSILRAPGFKSLKNGEISIRDLIIGSIRNFKSLFRDLIIGVNQIDHEKSENHGPETLPSHQSR